MFPKIKLFYFCISIDFLKWKCYNKDKKREREVNKMTWVLNSSYDYEYDESDYYDYEEVFEDWEEEEEEEN